VIQGRAARRVSRADEVSDEFMHVRKEAASVGSVEDDS
jgi:hypothetical protein